VRSSSISRPKAVATAKTQKPGKTTQVGEVTIVAPLNVPSLLAQDASELYAHNQYNLLVLMLKDNIIKIDWTDEVLAKTALTHDGKMSVVAEKPLQQSPPREQSSSKQAAHQSGLIFT